MSFLNPGLLWFLSLLLVPIIIHLFNLRRLQVVEYSSLQFIKEIREEVKRKKQLKNLLILLSRVLFLLFLILAFSRPILESEGNLETVGKSIIFIDNSYSSEARSKNGTAILSEEVNILQGFLEKTSADQRMALITNEMSSNLDKWAYKDQIIDELTELTYSPGEKSFSDLNERLNSASIQGELILVSDFQKGTLSDPSIFDIPVKMIPMTFDGDVNIYVDSAFFEDPILLFDEPSDLKIRLKYAGNGDGELSTRVKLLNDDKLIANTSVSWGTSKTAEVSFEIQFESLSSNRIKIELTDQSLEFDNSYYLTVQAFRRPTVEYVYSGQANSYLTEVYANQKLFDFRSSAIGDIVYENLNHADLIVLDGFDELPDGFLQFKDQANFLIVASSNPNLTNYSKFFNQSILTVSDTSVQALVFNDLDHPIVRDLFLKNTDNPEMPSSTARVNSTAGKIILKSTFNSPYLIDFENERSNSFLITAPLNLLNGNFQTHSIFVPLLYRIAQFSVQSNGVLAYSLNDRIIELSVGNLNSTARVQVVNSVGEFIPNYQVKANNLLMELPPADELIPGFYEVIVDSDTIETFALNHSKEESELIQYTIEELRDIADGKDNYTLLSGNTSSALDTLLNEGNSANYLWKYALLLALIFLTTEVLLVRFL